jgi:hypothetical protein
MLEAITGAVVGAALLLYPSKLGRQMTDRHAQRIAEIEAGAPEAHFEELRELKAYPPISGPAALRGLGAGLLTLSLALLAYQLL